MIKVLVIDDESDLAKMTKKVLEKNGYEVILANGGIAGLKKAGEYMPDIILLDLMMPDIMGFKVAERLKENPSTSNIPLIAFTVREKEEVNENASFSFFSGYLGKPFSNDQLIDLIELVLNRN